MWWRFLTIAAASLLPLSVPAADMPKEGIDNFTNVWAITISNTIQQGTHFFETYEINGVARNDAGGPMFNFFGLRCVGMENSREDSDDGTCTYTDKDGDNIFMPYTGKNGRGTHKVAGGTGKFARITGKGEWWDVSPAPIKSDDKRGRGVISNNVSWKLP